MIPTKDIRPGDIVVTPANDHYVVVYVVRAYDNHIEGVPHWHWGNHASLDGVPTQGFPGPFTGRLPRKENRETV